MRRAVSLDASWTSVRSIGLIPRACWPVLTTSFSSVRGAFVAAHGLVVIFLCKFAPYHDSSIRVKLPPAAIHLVGPNPMENNFHFAA